MRHIEFNLKKMLLDRIKEELGNDGKILRIIPVTVDRSYVIAEIGMEYKLYKIETDFPNIEEIDGYVREDPLDDFKLTRSGV